ncbi:MAG: hypothetical protein AAFV74_19995 [Pseudomonadota bacterium]
MTTQSIKSHADRVNDLESQLSDVEGLVIVLEIVAWELCQTSITDPRLRNLRSAVIALSSSLDRVLKDGEPATSAQEEAA